MRLREKIGKQACIEPIEQVANAFGVGLRFVQECLEAIAAARIEQNGGSIDENHPLPTPRYLGIDEFARRKGYRYDTILCDLVNHTVLEVSEGRTLEEVQKLLERLSTPDTVEAVSMDMCLFSPCCPTLLTEGTNCGRSFPCHSACDESLQEDCIELGMQIG